MPTPRTPTRASTPAGPRLGQSSASTPSLRSRDGTVPAHARPDGAGNVRVVVRVRAFLPREIERGARCLIDMDPVWQTTTLLPPPDTGDLKGDGGAGGAGGAGAGAGAAGGRSGRGRRPPAPRTFAFDRSLWSHDDSGDGSYVKQEDVYNCLGEEFLDHNFEGYHTCILAYGQTGSGKSYTMMGTPEQPGLIPRTCEDLFERIEAARAENAGMSYDVRVSYFEIYNEHVRDLLAVAAQQGAAPGSSIPIAAAATPTYLRIRESPTDGPYVQDLVELPVRSGLDEMLRLMRIGDASRTTASTRMNDASSRSHAVFTIMLKQMHHDMESDETTERCSRIRLVDLAGSERANATGAEGARLREGANINRSLTTLGRVIAALADPAGPVGAKVKTGGSGRSKQHSKQHSKNQNPSRHSHTSSISKVKAAAPGATGTPPSRRSRGHGEDEAETEAAEERYPDLERGKRRRQEDNTANQPRRTRTGDWREAEHGADADDKHHHRAQHKHPHQQHHQLHHRNELDSDSDSLDGESAARPSPAGVVPYRDSILTWLLKDSLGGNSKTAMIACVAPGDYEETLSTLRYADQARRIRTRAVVNQGQVSGAERDAQIVAMASEIRALQQRLAGDDVARQRDEDRARELDRYRARVADMQRLVDDRSLVADANIRSLQTENDALRTHLSLALDSLRNPIRTPSPAASPARTAAVATVEDEPGDDDEHDDHDVSVHDGQLPCHSPRDDQENDCGWLRDDEHEDVADCMRGLLGDVRALRRKIGDDRLRFLDDVARRRAPLAVRRNM